MAVRRYLLDTGIAQAFVNDHPGIRDRVIAERLKGNKIGICTPVLGELWSGVEGSATREKNLRKLKKGLSRLAVWPFERRAAAEFGRILTEMRRAGRIIQQIDIQIATIAKTLGTRIVASGDTDLAAVPGLRVENWALDHK
jgi:tRNA(fMet)-specific endonuclease VapC